MLMVICNFLYRCMWFLKIQNASLIVVEKSVNCPKLV